jgi:twitching motility protein PilI
MSSAYGDPHFPVDSVSNAVLSATVPEAQPKGAERRRRLRRYQAQLLERMHAAQSGAVAAGRQLGVQLGAIRCLLDLTQVSEIVPLQAVTPVPLTHDWYLGLANIRGNLTGVVDLARFCGEAPVVQGGECRIVTFAPALGLHGALLASRVLGLRSVDAMRADAVDAAIAPWCAQQYTDQDGQRWTRLDLALLVHEERFLQVGR